ncbi:nucleolar protein dao-5 [Anabrus simplex]|uniref:nucleolar protein dao-5 n=1 Tax=Anabrus simplex TaxID=316456 RepID=UPI0035A2E141
MDGGSGKKTDEEEEEADSMDAAGLKDGNDVSQGESTKGKDESSKDTKVGGKHSTLGSNSTQSSRGDDPDQPHQESAPAANVLVTKSAKQIDTSPSNSDSQSAENTVKSQYTDPVTHKQNLKTQNEISQRDEANSADLERSQLNHVAREGSKVAEEQMTEIGVKKKSEGGVKQKSQQQDSSKQTRSTLKVGSATGKRGSTTSLLQVESDIIKQPNSQNIEQTAGTSEAKKKPESAKVSQQKSEKLPSKHTQSAVVEKAVIKSETGKRDGRRSPTTIKSNYPKRTINKGLVSEKPEEKNIRDKKVEVIRSLPQQKPTERGRISPRESDKIRKSPTQLQQSDPRRKSELNKRATSNESLDKAKKDLSPHSSSGSLDKSKKDLSPHSSSGSLDKSKKDLSPHSSTGSLDKSKKDLSPHSSTGSLDKLKKDLSPHSSSGSLDKSKKDLSPHSSSGSLDKIKKDTSPHTSSGSLDKSKKDLSPHRSSGNLYKIQKNTSPQTNSGSLGKSKKDLSPHRSSGSLDKSKKDTSPNTSSGSLDKSKKDLPPHRSSGSLDKIQKDTSPQTSFGSLDKSKKDRSPHTSSGSLEKSKKDTSPHSISGKLDKSKKDRSPHTSSGSLDKIKEDTSSHTSGGSLDKSKKDLSPRTSSESLDKTVKDLSPRESLKQLSPGLKPDDKVQKTGTRRKSMTQQPPANRVQKSPVGKENELSVGTSNSRLKSTAIKEMTTRMKDYQEKLNISVPKGKTERKSPTSPMRSRPIETRSEVSGMQEIKSLKKLKDETNLKSETSKEVLNKVSNNNDHFVNNNVSEKVTKQGTRTKDQKKSKLGQDRPTSTHYGNDNNNSGISNNNNNYNNIVQETSKVKLPSKDDEKDENTERSVGETKRNVSEYTSCQQMVQQQRKTEEKLQRNEKNAVTVKPTVHKTLKSKAKESEKASEGVCSLDRKHDEVLESKFMTVKSKAACKECAEQELMIKAAMLQELGDNIYPQQTRLVEQTDQSTEEDGNNTPGCGLQSSTCPNFFGVRSYLHHFYETRNVVDDGIQEDDFEFLVDLTKDLKPKCCKGFWFRAGLWSGINLMLIGLIALMVGYFTPQRKMVVAYHDELEILDRWAIAFNHRLDMCRLVGLAVFCFGGVIVLITLLVSTFLHNNCQTCCDPNYPSISMIEPFIGDKVPPMPAGYKIPITEKIKSVQPTIWPDISPIKEEESIIVQMP